MISRYLKYQIIVFCVCRFQFQKYTRMLFYLMVLLKCSTRSLPDKKFEAKLVRKAGRIDHDSQSEIWEFEIGNTDNKLKPGSYAGCKIIILRQQEGIVVPASAVVTTLEKKFVIKVSNGVTHWIDVRPGFNMGDRTEIFGDVQKEILC